MEKLHKTRSGVESVDQSSPRNKRSLNPDMAQYWGNIWARDCMNGGSNSRGQNTPDNMLVAVTRIVAIACCCWNVLTRPPKAKAKEMLQRIKALPIASKPSGSPQLIWKRKWLAKARMPNWSQPIRKYPRRYPPKICTRLIGAAKIRCHVPSVRSWSMTPMVVMRLIMRNMMVKPTLLVVLPEISFVVRVKGCVSRATLGFSQAVKVWLKAVSQELLTVDPAIRRAVIAAVWTLKKIWLFGLLFGSKLHLDVSVKKVARNREQKSR